MTKPREIIVNKGKSFSKPIGKKEKRENLLPEQQPGYAEKSVEVMNELNGTDFKTLQEMSNAGVIKVVQIPTDLEKDGVPIGKLFNQAHYWIANDDYKKARTLLKSVGMSGLKAKLYVKDEIKLLERNPKERERYKNKPMPEEYKLLTDLFN